ncbi:MAG TPA: hypothetical protein VNN74_07355 [Candidatus Micrarchaeia archaeon]|nr:hypothetical protein [Candidatus Micrarchaeia archaeon]
MRIVAVDHRSPLDRLDSHPGAVTGDPADLVHVNWAEVWRP